MPISLIKQRHKSEQINTLYLHFIYTQNKQFIKLSLISTLNYYRQDNRVDKTDDKYDKNKELGQIRTQKELELIISLTYEKNYSLVGKRVGLGLQKSMSKWLHCCLVNHYGYHAIEKAINPLKITIA